MKKCICFLILLTLFPNVYADNDKKKKQQQSQSSGKKSAAGALSGGGGHTPGMPHSNAPVHPKQPGLSPGNQHGSTSASHVASHSGSSMSAGKAAGSGMTSSGTARSNPLMRHGGQGKTTGKPNPLTQKSNQSAAGTRNPLQKGGQPGNPPGQKGATQLGHNPGHVNSMAARNIHSPGNRAINRAVVHGSRANYHVRPYREVFHSYQPIRHDRFWYANHYDRVVIVGGGYYYWDAGYWYPAWGYDPTFSLYVYDGPIYSYDNLPPDQIIVNVQTELQDQGYYTGEVDGQLGPQTRDALGAFQADHDLEVTSAVDEPTVEALGLSQST